MFRTRLINKNIISSHDVPMDCSTYTLGKNKILPFPMHDTLASKCFDIVHSDVWGITPVISHTHYKYFVTFIDDHSWFTSVYFLRSKLEVFDAFRLAYVKNQLSTSIKILRSWGQGGMCPINFKICCNKKG